MYGHGDCCTVSEGSTTRDDIEISTPETFATKAADATTEIVGGDAFALDSSERTATDVAREISAAGDRDDAETEDEDGGNDDEEEQKQQEESDAHPANTESNTTATSPAEAAAIVSPRATRRTTLSPSKTSLFMNNSDSSIIDDSAISRRDTVSPAALKSLLQSITLNDESPTAARARQEKAVSAPAPTAENDTASSDSDGVHDYIREYMGASNQFLESSSTVQQTPESARRMRAMKRKEREERTLSPSEALSMTLSDLAPRRSSAEKSKSPAKRSLLSPESSGTETLQEETQEEEEGTTPRRQLHSSEKKSRRSTLEPTDAADFLSALREEMQEDAKHESDSGSKTTQDKSRSTRRQTTATHFETDVSPVTRSRSRRATVDPSDILSITSGGRGRFQDEVAKHDGEGKHTRRVTLEVEDLYEINPQLRSTHQAAMDVDAEGNGLDAMSRKRKQDQPASDTTTSSSHAGKKPRSDDDSTHTESPPQDSLVSRKTKEAAGLTRPQKTPTPRKPPRSATTTSTAQDREEKTSGRESVRGGDKSDRQSILAKFSSPAQSSRIKTPLKSILSAKKPKAGPITTPTKSVNFGPSQGAEFNLGSPSTSMTPMLAKDARRMFPLDGTSSPPSLQELDEEEEDEETSLNTSLLDEADAIDSDDAEQKEERDDDDTTEMAISRLSFLTRNRSPENRRRYSLRGVSPMDNQANARRLRRNSVAAVVRSPVSARKLKGIGPYALQSAPAPPSASKSNFLAQTDDAEPQGRTAYADSSASSDAGEDMEITGDFSAFVQAGGNMFASNSKAPAATTPSFRFRSQVQETKESSSPFGDSLVEDETVELGSLGDLVAESAAYDEAHQSRAQQQQSTSQKSSTFVQGEDDSQAPALGSLSDLAREGEEQSPRANRLSSTTMRRFNSLHYSQLDDQDITLDPIMEEEEDAANSSAPSMMDMETSEDESDAEYDERRKSLVVNLSSKFERVGSGTPKSRTAPESEVTAADLGARIRSPLRQSPRRKSVASEAPTVPLISMEELLATANLQTEASTTPDDHFNDLYSPSTGAGSTVDAIKRASISNACKDIVKWHIDEISSWSAGLTDVLGSLLSEKAPAMFSPELFDESGVGAVKALHDLETARVQSGLCQWRTKMESEIGEKLEASADELEKDVRTLKQRIAKDTATRQSELAALQELIDREKQMSELLDAIEEQQSVRNEYAAAVDVLDTQCASLSLEASVLEDQLRVVENLAANGNLISAETAAELERQVLNVEEISAIQGSLSVWRIGVATSSHLKLSAQFDDVVVRVELQVDVVLNGSELSSNGGFSTDVASSVTLKRRRRSSYLAEADSDIVRLVQQKLFDPVQLSRFIRTTNSSQHGDDQRLDRPRRICALLQELERYVTLSHRFLRELRLLSAQYAVEFIAEESVLWVEFLNFTPLREAKFVVGFAILDEFPFSNFETSVHVVYGPVRLSFPVPCLWCPEDLPTNREFCVFCFAQVSPDDIRVEIEAEAAKQSEYEYISRICERLRNAFVSR